MFEEGFYTYIQKYLITSLGTRLFIWTSCAKFGEGAGGLVRSALAQQQQQQVGAGSVSRFKWSSYRWARASWLWRASWSQHGDSRAFFVSRPLLKPVVDQALGKSCGSRGEEGRAPDFTMGSLGEDTASPQAITGHHWATYLPSAAQSHSPHFYTLPSTAGGWVQPPVNHANRLPRLLASSWVLPLGCSSKRSEWAEE